MSTWEVLALELGEKDTVNCVGTVSFARVVTLHWRKHYNLGQCTCCGM